MQVAHQFAVHIWDHAWWFLTNIILVFPTAFKWIPEERRKKIQGHHLVVKMRTPTSLGIYLIAMSGVVIASYLSFKDQYDLSESLSRQLGTANATITAQKKELDDPLAAVQTLLQAQCVAAGSCAPRVTPVVNPPFLNRLNNTTNVDIEKYTSNP
jgi:hypothetical protein